MLMLQVCCAPGGGGSAGVVGGGRDPPEPGHVVADHRGQFGHGPDGVGSGGAGSHRPQLVDGTSADQGTPEPQDEKGAGVLREVQGFSH